MLNGEKYRAPPVDIWSSGIVLYAMLCGYLPFEDDDNDVLYDKICKGKFTIPNHVSEKARDLLNKILVTDPKKRLTIHQIRNHPWFSLYNDDKGKLMMNEGLLLTKYVVPVDEDVVSSMNKKFNISKEKIRISILSNKHDNISTIYYLLLHKKIRNKKKSVADIKGELFKKYCDNKNNLFEKYDKDINKVIEERKNGYLNNFQNSPQPKDLSTNLTEIKRKINSLIEDNENNDKLINAKRLRYFSPEITNRFNKLNKFSSFRDWNKSSKKNETKKIMKYKTNLNAFKPKYNTIIKDKESNKKGKSIKIIHKNGKKEN
jgi:serine/threonine protein kinase